MQLNENQERIAQHREGRAMALACPGSGKTRVVTERTTRLLKEGVPPQSILSVTFTNKARDEMIERLVKQYGDEARKVFVSNFHGFCGRVLRRFGGRLGYTDSMTIADSDDQEGLLKKIALRRYTAAGYDEDNLPVNPGKVRFLASACNWMRETLDDGYIDGLLAANKLTEIDVRVIEEYVRTLRDRNQCDFSGMLSETVRLLRGNPDVADALKSRFRFIQVDEMQDTNKAQMEIIELVADAHDNVLGVGDVDQCVVAESLISTEGGDVRASEVSKGTMVLCGLGGGKTGFRRVSRVHRKKVSRTPVVRVRTTSGRTLTTTPEHLHFAEFHEGREQFFVYLMYAERLGYRIGVTRMSRSMGGGSVTQGFKLRMNQERADAVWVLSCHDDEASARLREQYLSVSYGIPTWVFHAGSGRGTKYRDDHIQRLFEAVPTECNAKALLAEHMMFAARPHHCPKSVSERRRRNFTVTVCGDARYDRNPMHRYCVSGSDSADAAVLAGRGFKVRPAKGRRGWRVEGCDTDLGKVYDLLDKTSEALPLNVIEQARLAGVSLLMTPASHVRRGMTVYVRDGDRVSTEQVESVQFDLYTGEVLDFDVEGVHNYCADGIFTHNSIYSWRGADPAAIDAFISRGKAKTGACAVYKLDTNYRSTPQIIAASSRLISCSSKRHSMDFKASNEPGDPVKCHFFVSPEEEANWVGQQCVGLISGGHSAKEIAVFYRQNDMSRLIEQALVRRGVKYKISGGGSFYDRMEIRDTLAILRVICNPKDHASFHRIANKPARAMGDTTLGMIENYCEDTGTGLLEALGDPHLIVATVEGKSGKTVKGLTEAARSGCRTLAAALRPEQGVPIWQVADRALRLLKYDEYLKDKCDPAEYEDRRRNQNELVNSMRDFCNASPKATLADYLQSISLYTEGDDGKDEDGVQLMSIHASKGKEFDAVFVIGSEEGVVPHKRVLSESGDAGVEEERRLYYVAMTRARKRLRLSFCLTRTDSWGRGGRANHCRPSRFLTESGVLSPEEADRISREAQRRGYGAAPQVARG